MAIDMTKLTSIQREVIERLEREYEGCKTAGSHGGVLNGPVLNVLKGFCASDAEFATLLHDTDKTLKGCFEAVSKQGYSGTSDFEVYSNAIRYYLPGVTVHMTLWVDMQGVDEGVAFGRDGEATLDVYGKGKVKERAAAEDKHEKKKNDAPSYFIIKQRAAMKRILKIIGKFCRMGGFTGTLQTAHHDNGGRFGGKIKLGIAIPHNAAQLFMHDLDNLLSGREGFHDLFADRTRRYVVDKGLNDLEVDVGTEQSQLDLAHDLFDVALGQLTAPLKTAEDIA
jgi:hypothetical protein